MRARQLGKMDVIKQARLEREYKKSVQEMMDKKMCKPGYTWTGEPLNRCLPAAVPADYRPEPAPEPAPDTDPLTNPEVSEGSSPIAQEISPEQAIQQEKMARAAGKKG